MNMFAASSGNNKELSWLSEDEGQLSVDVLEDDRFIYVRAAVAGTRAEDLDISVTHDTVTIRGKRRHGCEHWSSATAHIQECYWGAYSRSIVLPGHVRPEKADAEIRNGILTITMPKAEMASTIDVKEID